MSSLQPRWRLALKQIECFLKRGRSPDWYIFESEAMRDMGVRGRGIRAARTDIVRTGVDYSAFSADSVRTLLPHERFGIPGERLVVVFMGHLHKRKGVHVLIEAMKLIVVGRGRTDLHALILGNRPEEVPQFASLLENSTASGHVTFGGYHEDVPAILAGCDIGCIPSTGWDSYPMSSLEMQASGLPVVVTDLQGVPETVDPEVTGLVVPAGDPEALSDALERLADDPQLRSRMGAAGAARIRRELTVDLQIQRLSHSMARAFSTRPR